MLLLLPAAVDIFFASDCVLFLAPFCVLRDSFFNCLVRCAIYIYMYTYIIFFLIIIILFFFGFVIKDEIEKEEAQIISGLLLKRTTKNKRWKTVID